MTTGKYAGIGSVIRYHKKEERAVITEPFENSPSHHAGLKAGDLIMRIDGKDVKGWGTNKVTGLLRGEPGTTFELVIRRGGEEKTLHITRQTIQTPDIPYYGIINNGIGYICLTGFTDGDYKEVRRVLTELKQQGADKLILDLRGNPGGSVNEAVDIVNLFVPKGRKVVSTKGKMKYTNRDYLTAYEPVDTLMPLVVLIDGISASASEIVAGSLQDMDRAVVMGIRSYGKGLVQMVRDVPYDGHLKITTGRYYIPSGRCIQAVNYKRDGKERIADSLTRVFYTRDGREVRDGGGIMPDVEVKNDTMSNIAYYLSAGGLDSTEVLFDYVVDYIDRHPAIAPAKDFRLTDEDWQAFRQRVIDSGFSYDPVSKKQFGELVKTAKFEGYYEDAKDAFDALEKKLKHDVATDLDKYRETIQQIIELDIIGAYYYQKGSIEASLNGDKQLKEAVRLLKSPEEYQKILLPKQKK